MDVLATRVVSYTDDNGTTREVILTVFVPFEDQPRGWKCELVFDPPIYRTAVHGAGVDFIHAFLVGLKVARIFFESTALFGRAHRQGMLDCGLLSRAEKPASLEPTHIQPLEDNPGDMDVLTTRRLGFPDENGVERDLLLTLFVPFKTEGGVWKCGFAFGVSQSAPVRYGVGADVIEALLDALAGARAAFEGQAPKIWEGSGELLDCADFPYKIGRSFFTDPAREPPPPDLTDVPTS